jgi:20S proteasome alpha/beta subunit
MSKYDSAITVFSPDGHLFQVEYAMEAVKKGRCAIGIRGRDCIILAVERKTAAKLQDTRTAKKINQLDEKLAVAFSGLTADARVLIDKARVECQSFRLTMDYASSAEYMARFVARIQQENTQKGGVRPYGVSMFIAGYDRENQPKLFLTEPSGAFSQWKANAIGRNSKLMLEYLEANYHEELSYAEALKLAVRTLIQVVEKESRNIEVAVLQPEGLRMVEDSEVERTLGELEQS